MTVSTNDNKIIYAGNGTTVTFPVPFLFYDDAHVVVRTKKDETVTDCVRGVDYSIAGTGDDNGGTVTFFAAPDDGTQVSILREVPFVQNTQYLDGDPMPAELLERNLDVLTMQTQQLKEQSDRAVTVDVFSNSDPSQIVGKIEVLYDDRENLNTVAEHIAAVDVCSDNIEAIRDAPNQAAAASASASAATLAEAGAADSRDKAAASESSAVVSRDKASASENKAREYALQAVRRNVGDIFYTSRTDTALNGAVPADGSIYNVSDFSGENAVPALLAAGKLPYISMAEYAERLASREKSYTEYYGNVAADGYWTPEYNGRLLPNAQIKLGEYDTWYMKTRIYCRAIGGSSQRHIFGMNSDTDYKCPAVITNTGGVVLLYASSTGTGWNILNGANAALTLKAETTYDLMFGYDGANYYFRWKYPTDTEWTQSYTLANANKVYCDGNYSIGNGRLTATWTGGLWNNSSFYLPETEFVGDGTVLWKGDIGKRSEASVPVFGWDGAGSTTFRVPLAEKPKRVLVAKKESSGNGDPWYNLYSDGWIEQGGTNGATVAAWVSQIYTLPRPFKDTNYYAKVSSGHTAQTSDEATVTAKATSSFAAVAYNSTGLGMWYACGYGESPTEAEYQFQNIEAQRAMVQVATGNTDNALVTATTVLPRMNRLEERFQIVSALPENPDPETFYFVVKGD